MPVYPQCDKSRPRARRIREESRFVLGQRPEEPGAGKRPIILGGRNGNAKNPSYFVVRHPREAAELDDFGLYRMFRGEFVEHFMNRE